MNEENGEQNHKTNICLDNVSALSSFNPVVCYDQAIILKFMMQVS